MRILPLALVLLLIMAGPAFGQAADPPFTWNGPVVVNDNVTFTANLDPVLGAAVTRVEWDFGTDSEPVSGSDDTAPFTGDTKYKSAGPRQVTMRAFIGDVATPYTRDITVDPPPNPAPTASFRISPNPAQVGQEVLFLSNSSDQHPGGGIVRHEWDLDGNGTYERDTGADGTTEKTYGAADDSLSIRLRVTDTGGKTDEAKRDLKILAPPPNKLPVAQFSVTPPSPTVGEQVTLKSFSVDPDGSIKDQRWDLDGDGDFSENVTGPTAFTTFVTAGTRIVRLKVTDNEDGVQTDTVEITVKPAPAAPPPVTPPTTPGGTNPTSPKAKLSLLGSLALVRLAGSATMKATRVQILQVRAPTKSLVEVRCAGKGCPTKSVRKRVKRKPLRFDVLERSLRGGTVLTVFIRKSGYVGKYTSFLLRPGKAPKRSDGCVMPGKTKRVRCPSA